MNSVKVITGKVSIFAGGHKDENGNTGFRDSNGNFHAEFFKASVGEMCESDGKYHSYSWSINPTDAEELANAPLGTTFKVTLRAKMDEDDAGNLVPQVTPSRDGGTVYHDCTLVEIEPDKIGKLERRRFVQYIADIKVDDDDDDIDG